MKLLDNAIVSLNNMVVKGRHPQVDSSEILLLFSSCLQCSQCEQRITSDLARCKRCGKCPVKGLLDLADELGVQPFVATGGHLALQKAMEPSVKVIVAVACEKELREGLLGCFPKPVLAVSICKPNGPCHDTDINPAVVRQAVQSLLKKEE